MKIGRKITLILLAIFFIGLSLLLYPSISSYWNSITQSKVVADYDAMLKSLTPKDYSDIFAAAADYNTRLAALDFPLMEYTALTEDYANGYSVIYYLAYMLRWDMLLVLLPAVYGLLRAAAVRWSGQGCLLNRPYLQVTGILWLISLAVEIVRWIVTLPPMQAFAATTLSSGTRTYQALWDEFAATLPFLYVPRITAAVVLMVLAVTALAVRRKNGAGAAQSKDEAA